MGTITELPTRVAPPSTLRSVGSREAFRVGEPARFGAIDLLRPGD